MLLPACVAWMVQVPTETSVTVEPVSPDTVQTAVVCELKLTVKPEEAVALTVNGAAPKGWFPSAPKVMVWVAEEMIVVESAAFALPDPPPDTLTAFNCGEVALAATFTVTVMAG